MEKTTNLKFDKTSYTPTVYKKKSEGKGAFREVEKFAYKLSWRFGVINVLT